MDRWKPLTYAAMHLIVAMAVAFALTGSWAVALGVGMVEPLIQTVAYSAHENAWRRYAGSRADARG